MAYDIAKIFSDNGIIQDTGAEDVNEGMLLSKLVMQGPAAVAAARLPRAARQIGSSLGGMLGLDTRDKNEVLAEQLKRADLSTVDGINRAAALIEKTHGGTAALGWKSQMLQRLQENKLEQDKLVIEQQNADSRTSVADTGVINAETQAERNRILQQAEDNEAARVAAIVVQNKNAAEQTRLAQDKFAFDQTDQSRFRSIQEEQNRLEGLRIESNNTQLSNQDKTLINTSIEKAIEAQQKGAKAIGLASQFERTDPLSGIRGNVVEGFKNFLGTQDEVSMMKTEFTGLVNESMVAGLPPGVASDKDIELVQQGFPTSDYNAEMIQRYMRGLAKIAFIEAERQSLMAEHANENRGSLAGFQQKWDERRNAEGFIAELEAKHNVNFITSGEEDDIDTTAQGRAAKKLRESEASGTTVQNNTVIDNRRRRSGLVL